MSGFWGSVELMVFIYALAAVVSFGMAGIIKLIFAGIQWQKARADARSEVSAGNGAPEKTA